MPIPIIWRSSAWAGLYGDPYIFNTELEGTYYISLNLFRTLLSFMYFRIDKLNWRNY